MNYLVVCAHEQFVTNTKDEYSARDKLECTKCHHYNLKKAEVKWKDVRVYKASEEDIRLLGGLNVHHKEPEKEAAEVKR